MNVDKDSCPRYHLRLAWDLSRARACLGAHSVLSTEEYAQRHNNTPLVVRHVHCWNGPLGMCKPKWQPKAVIGKNCLGTAVVRGRRRLRFSTRPVRGLTRWTGVRWRKGREEWRLQLLNEDGRVAVKEKAGVRFACLPRFSNLSQVVGAYGEVRDRVLVVGDLVGTAVQDLWPASHWLVQALGGGGGGGGMVTRRQAVAINRQNGSLEGSEEGNAPSRNASGTLTNDIDSIVNTTFSEAATQFLARQPAGYTNPLLGTLEDWTSMLAPLSALYPSAPIAPHALVFARARAVISFLFGAAQSNEGHRQLVRTLLEEKNHSAFWQQVSNHSESSGRSSSSSSSDDSSDDSSSAHRSRFLAVHWRRGDWWMYCAVAGPPGACNFASAQAAYCVVKVARKHNLTNIFLATNAKQSEASGVAHLGCRLLGREPSWLLCNHDSLLKLERFSHGCGIRELRVLTRRLEHLGRVIYSVSQKGLPVIGLRPIFMVETRRVHGVQCRDFNHRSSCSPQHDPLPSAQVERFSYALGPSYMVARLPPILPTGKDPLLHGIPPDERTEVTGMLGLLLDKVIAAHAAVFLRTRGSSLSKDVLRLRLGVAHHSSQTADTPSSWSEEQSFSASGFVDDVLCDGQKEWNPMEGLSPFFRATKLNRMRRALPAEWPL